MQNCDGTISTAENTKKNLQLRAVQYETTTNIIWRAVYRDMRGGVRNSAQAESRYVKARKRRIFLFAALTSAATIFEAEARCSCSRFQFGALMT